MSLRTVNIRALKDHLSAHLKDVQRGDVFLVTDRGRVVAEVRSPTVGQPAVDSVEVKEQMLVDQGLLRLGLPNTPDAYGDTNIRLCDGDIDSALAWGRGEP
jgi:antitoxin (DNA-binding transcriptional repressor) of toxin-antitoxin stability system